MVVDDHRETGWSQFENRFKRGGLENLEARGVSSSPVLTYLQSLLTWEDDMFSIENEVSGITGGVASSA